MTGKKRRKNGSSNCRQICTRIIDEEDRAAEEEASIATRIGRASRNGISAAELRDLLEDSDEPSPKQAKPGDKSTSKQQVFDDGRRRSSKQVKLSEIASCSGKSLSKLQQSEFDDNSRRSSKQVKLSEIASRSDKSLSKLQSKFEDSDRRSSKQVELSEIASRIGKSLSKLQSAFGNSSGWSSKQVRLSEIASRSGKSLPKLQSAFADSSGWSSKQVKLSEIASRSRKSLPKPQSAFEDCSSQTLDKAKQIESTPKLHRLFQDASSLGSDQAIANESAPRLHRIFEDASHQSSEQANRIGIEPRLHRIFEDASHQSSEQASRIGSKPRLHRIFEDASHQSSEQASRIGSEPRLHRIFEDASHQSSEQANLIGRASRSGISTEELQKLFEGSSQQTLDQTNREEFAPINNSVSAEELQRQFEDGSELLAEQKERIGLTSRSSGLSAEDLQQLIEEDDQPPLEEEEEEEETDPDLVDGTPARVTWPCLVASKEIVLLSINLVLFQLIVPAHWYSVSKCLCFIQYTILANNAMQNKSCAHSVSCSRAQRNAFAPPNRLWAIVDCCRLLSEKHYFSEYGKSSEGRVAQSAKTVGSEPSQRTQTRGSTNSVRSTRSMPKKRGHGKASKSSSSASKRRRQSQLTEAELEELLETEYGGEADDEAGTLTGSVDVPHATESLLRRLHSIKSEKRLIYAKLHETLAEKAKAAARSSQGSSASRSGKGSVATGRSSQGSTGRRPPSRTAQPLIDSPHDSLPPAPAKKIRVPIDMSGSYRSRLDSPDNYSVVSLFAPSTSENSDELERVTAQAAATRSRQQSRSSGPHAAAAGSQPAPALAIEDHWMPVDFDQPLDPDSKEACVAPRKWASNCIIL